jgi:glycosyltransferase involved in cell wall biosynthesis
VPLFTVITITYNSATFLEQTIRSVLAQEYEDFEYIIGDDCSKDETWQVIERFSDARIKSYRNDVNIGEYGNRTKAIQQASGKYLIFIDGDDYLYPNALKSFTNYVASFPDCAMLFLREWDPRILCPYKVEPADIFRFEYFDRGIVGGNFTKVLFKTALIKQYSFPKNIRSGDIYIQLKISQKYSGVVVPDGFTWWRRRAGNATEKLFSNDRHLAESINYRIDLLNGDCPLPEHEIEMAKRNIYGLYLRQLIRIIMRFKWTTVIFLLKNIKVPIGYYKCILIPSRHNYFGYITGDKPLHSDSNIKSH